MITQGFPTKSYNVQNSNKKKQQQSDNVPPSSSQQNIKSTNLPKTKKQKWAHLEVLFGVWSMGFRILKEPLFLIPFQGMDDISSHWNKEKIAPYKMPWKCKKWRFGDGFQENEFVAKVVKNTKIWKDIEGNGWNQV